MIFAFSGHFIDKINHETFDNEGMVCAANFTDAMKTIIHEYGGEDYIFDVKLQHFSDADLFTVGDDLRWDLLKNIVEHAG